MNFNNNKAIYEQMADRLCDEIIAGTYKADDRIPSVRDYAVTLQVNTNTAVKAMRCLPVKVSFTTVAAWATSSPPMLPLRYMQCAGRSFSKRCSLSCSGRCASSVSV